MKNQEQNPKSPPDLISNLPIDIIFDIITRLPLKTISNCRYISKTWFNFILNPRFAQHHLTKFEHNLPLAIFPTRYGKSYLVNPEDLSKFETSVTAYELNMKKFKENFSISEGYWARFDVIGIANGLVCFAPEGHDYEPVPYYIVNPITRDYLLVPESPLIDVQPVASGFGFDSINNEYKVVRILPSPKRVKSDEEYVSAENEDEEDFAAKEERIRTVDNVVMYGNRYEIFTMSKGTWKEIYLPEFTTMSMKPFSVVVNGCIHWESGKMTAKEYSGTILQFDMGREKLSMMPMPMPMPRLLSDGEKLKSLDLLVLNECLCLMESGAMGSKNIWVMKKYGVHSSWVKEYSFRPDVFYGRLHGYHEVMELKNGELLLVDKEENLSYYDRKKKISKSIMLHDRDGNRVDVQPDFAVCLNGSLLSPKAILCDQSLNSPKAIVCDQRGSAGNRSTRSLEFNMRGKLILKGLSSLWKA